MEIVSFKPVKYLNEVRYDRKAATIEILGDVFFKMDGVVSEVSLEYHPREQYHIDSIPDGTETAEIFRNWLTDEQPITFEGMPYGIWVEKDNRSYLSFSFCITLPRERIETMIRLLMSKLAEFDFQVTDPEPEFNVSRVKDRLHIEDIATGTSVEFLTIPTETGDIDKYLTQVYDYIVQGKPIDGVEITLGEGVVIDNPLGYNILVKLLSQLKDFIENPNDSKFRKLVITNV